MFVVVSIGSVLAVYDLRLCPSVAVIGDLTVDREPGIIPEGNAMLSLPAAVCHRCLTRAAGGVPTAPNH